MNLEDKMNNWVNEILSKCNIFNKNIDYINFVKELEDEDIILDKYYANKYGSRIYVSTNKYNYRIYIDYKDYGMYLLEIRKKLSEIYKGYGVFWNIYYAFGENYIVTIEEREKLKVCCENDFTCDELLLNWKRTLDKLSEELKFSEILKQIRDKITSYKKIEVYMLVLIKDGVVNASDFAITSNSNVVLLEDYEFSFCLTNYKGELIPFHGLFLDVDTTCGIMTFSLKHRTVFYKNYNRLYDCQEKFFLYDNPCKNDYLKDNVFYYDDSLKSQIRIFTDNEKNEAKYEIEYIEKYFDKLKLCGKSVCLLGENKELFFERKNGKRIS